MGGSAWNCGYLYSILMPSPGGREPMHLILYSKSGCHLCEGLEEKLRQITRLPLQLEVRDITTRLEWFQAYEYEIPVLIWVQGLEAQPDSDQGDSKQRTYPPELFAPDPANLEASGAAVTLVRLPRLSPRATIAQVEQMLQIFLAGDRPQ